MERGTLVGCARWTLAIPTWTSSNFSSRSNCLDLSAPRRGQQRGEILDALSVRKGERSRRDLGRALLR
jgi:hypothetical protein